MQEQCNVARRNIIVDMSKLHQMVLHSEDSSPSQNSSVQTGPAVNVASAVAHGRVRTKPKAKTAASFHMSTVACDALSLRRTRPFTLPDVPDGGPERRRGHA
jgi:hypothetical protein